MKISATAPVFILLMLYSCTKTEVKTERAENNDGFVTVKTTEVVRRIGPDSAKINATMEDVKSKLDKAGTEIKEAAQETGAKIKKATSRPK